MTRPAPRRSQRRPAPSPRRPSGSCSCSCRARPASATRSTTSRSLIKTHGQPFDPGGKVELFQSTPGAVMKSPWGWRQYGECGKCDQRPRAAPRRVRRRHRVHARRWSRSRTSTGRRRSCRTPGSCCPGSRAWGRGSRTGSAALNENLPTFVVLPDSRGFAPNGPANWGAGFLPATHQGTMVRPSATGADPRPVPARRGRVHRPPRPSATDWRC